MQHWTDYTPAPTPAAFAPTKLVTAAEAAANTAAVVATSANKVVAFYSSVAGGVCTDPAAMSVVVDDHAFHRGHAVFDTCNVKGGFAYGLDFHLDRLLQSAKRTRIDEAGAWTKARLRDAVLATVAATQLRDNVFVRYWLSAGSGSFSVSPSSCVGEAHLYVVCHEYAGKEIFGGSAVGVSEAFVDIPVKSKLLATAKTNNYLVNAMAAMQAEDKTGKKGALGIQCDANGNIAEQSIANLACVGADKVLRTPPFEGILHGTTMARILELAPSLVEEGLLAGVEAGSPLAPDTARGAAEVLSLGGGGIFPITEIDGKAVGTGKVGPVYLRCAELLQADQALDLHREAVPYERFA